VYKRESYSNIDNVSSPSWEAKCTVRRKNVKTQQVYTLTVVRTDADERISTNILS